MKIEIDNEFIPLSLNDYSFWKNESNLFINSIGESVDSYLLDNILMQITHNNKLHNPDLYAIFVHENKYYFTLVNNLAGNKYESIIYEYLPTRNRIALIARFDFRDVVHIEFL